MIEEQWKTIPGFEDYLISSNGRLKSFKKGIEKELKGSMSKNGYLQFSIKTKTYGSHQLVAMAFLGHKPCGLKLVIDHIDENKLNNHVSNLRIVSNRFNSRRNRTNTSSKFKGIYYDKIENKWRSNIVVNKKRYSLGCFDDENEASNIYKKAVYFIENEDTENLFKLIKVQGKQFKGTTFCKRIKKWRSYITHKGVKKYLGYYDCRICAHLEYLKESKKIKAEKN